MIALITKYLEEIKNGKLEIEISILNKFYELEKIEIQKNVDNNININMSNSHLVDFSSEEKDCEKKI